MGLQVDDVQMPLAAVWRRTFQFGPMDEDKFIRFFGPWYEGAFEKH